MLIVLACDVVNCVSCSDAATCTTCRDHFYLANNQCQGQLER